MQNNVQGVSSDDATKAYQDRVQNAVDQDTIDHGLAKKKQLDILRDNAVQQVLFTGAMPLATKQLSNSEAKMHSYKTALQDIKLGLEREIAFCNKLKKIAALTRRNGDSLISSYDF